MSRSAAALLVEHCAVQDMGLHVEGVCVRTFLEELPKPHETLRVEELVAVDPEHPGLRASEGLDYPVRVSGVVDLLDSDVIEIPGEPGQHLTGSVGRDMVERVDAIAERRDIPDGPLDENVLVVDEDDTDDAQGQTSSPTTTRLDPRSPASAASAPTMNAG